MVTLVVVLSGVAAWWFLWSKTTPGAGGVVLRAPGSAQVVGLSTVGSDLQLSPVGSGGEGVLRYESVSVVHVEGEGEAGGFVVGFDDAADSPSPLWSYPVDSSFDGCALVGSTLEVEGVSLDVETGLPAQGSGEVAGSVGDDDVSADDPALVGGSLLADRVDGASLLSIVDGLGASSWWVLDPDGGSEVLVVSDGETAIGVVDGEEIWRVVLPVGSAGVSGFPDRPTWGVVADAVLLGTPDAFVAVSVATGEELWRVEAPVGSFQIAGDEVVLVSGGSLVVLPLSDGDGAQSSSTDELSVSIAARVEENESLGLPTEADFRDATLPLPASCTFWSTGFVEEQVARGEAMELPNPPVLAHFSDGSAPGAHGSFVEQQVFAPVVLDGEPRAALILTCPVNLEEEDFVIAVYTPSGELISSTSLYGDFYQPIYPTFKDAFFSGSNLTAELGMMRYEVTGESNEIAQIKSYWTWTEGAYRFADITYETPSGLTRFPDSELTRAIEPNVVGCGLIEDALGWLHQPDPHAISGKPFDGSYKGFRTGVSLHESLPWPDVGQQAGDWVCAVDTANKSQDEWGYITYGDSLIIRTDSSGTPTLIGKVGAGSH